MVGTDVLISQKVHCSHSLLQKNIITLLVIAWKEEQGREKGE